MTNNYSQKFTSLSNIWSNNSISSFLAKLEEEKEDEDEKEEKEEDDTLEEEGRPPS